MLSHIWALTRHIRPKYFILIISTVSLSATLRSFTFPIECRDVLHEDEIDGKCIGSVRKGPGEWGLEGNGQGQAEEEMNMDICDRDGVGGKKVRGGGDRVGKGIEGKEDDREGEGKGNRK